MITPSRARWLALFILGFTAVAETPRAVAGEPDPARAQLPARWWEHASASRFFVLSATQGHEVLALHDPDQLAKRLAEVRAQGFSAIHLMAPADGRANFGGLDTTNFDTIRSDAGTMDEFRRMVRIAHEQKLAVTISTNLGYASIVAPFWLKACDDVREGRKSAEAGWFVWSDTGSAAAPPSNAYFNPPGRGFWEYSARAKKYFWTRWGGTDDEGAEIRFPQYDWSNPGFQQEAERVVRVWMDTGIDGVMSDAVNWSTNSNWDQARRRVTTVMASYGNVWIEGEGAGGFGEDPLPWITEGRWNSLEDYGLGVWWEAGSHVVSKAFKTGDPRGIETALRGNHDRVVTAGGTFFASPVKLEDPVVPTRKEAPHLGMAAMIGLGDLLGYDARALGGEPDGEVRWLLHLKRDHAALQQTGSRRLVSTNADDKFYAFVRMSPDRSERILCVFNYQRGFQKIEVDLAGIENSGLQELRTGEELPASAKVTVSLYSYGYRFYLIKPSGAP